MHRMEPVRPTWQSYTVAVALVAIATGVRVWPLQDLGLGVNYITFYPAVVLAALYGGLCAGLLSTLCSCLVLVFGWPVLFGVPIITDFGGWLSVAVFVMNCTLISGVTEAMHRSRSRADQAQLGLQRSIAELKRVRDDLEEDVRKRTAELTETNAALERELTERTRAEDEVRKAKDNLEIRVQERTAELEKAKDTVAAERQRLYRVLEALPVYVVLLSKDYYMPFANRFFRERFGESHDNRCFEYLFGRSEPCEICETYTVLRTMAPHHWEWTAPDCRNYDIHDFPFTDTDGSLLIMEMGIDVTERKQAEADLRLTLADLTRSNADLEHFAYVASHDLQEPLRNVASALQMLERRHKGKLGSESDQLIGYAVDSAKKMKALISDLLSYSRVATLGRPFEAVNVQEVLEQSLRNLRSLIHGKTTEITSDAMPLVQGDATQLLQVFQNLIENAVKFGPNESPKVHVSARKIENDWVFSIQDNGIGIDANYFDRIFIIFQQLSKKGPFEGTGMGLAIVKKIVERHRGRVWVEAELGVGSTFYFSIPDKAAA